MDKHIVGPIYAHSDSYTKEKEVYTIVSPITGQGWGLPVDKLSPDDLRTFADYLEKRRAEQS